MRASAGCEYEDNSLLGVSPGLLSGSLDKPKKKNAFANGAELTRDLMQETMTRAMETNSPAHK